MIRYEILYYAHYKSVPQFSFEQRIAYKRGKKCENIQGEKVVGMYIWIYVRCCKVDIWVGSAKWTIDQAKIKGNGSVLAEL